MADITIPAATPRVGQPVKVNDVEAQLADLWRQVVGDHGDAVLRATTLNLIVDSDQPDRVLALIERIAQRHPCRAIVLAPRDTDDPSVPQSVTATPQLLVIDGQAAPQVTSEVIVLTAGLANAGLLAGSAQGLIVADQLAFLWRLRNSPAPFTLDDVIFRALAESLDGLVIDSALIAGETSGLRTLAELVDHKVASFLGCVHDLTWLRLNRWRQALANLFDPVDVRAALYTATDLTINAGGSSVEAWLLLGWLADRLDWQLAVNPLPSPDAQTLLATAQATNRSIAVRIVQEGEAGVHRVAFTAGEAQYSVAEGDNCLTLHVASKAPRVQAGSVPDMSALVGLALDSDGCDPLYVTALQRLIPLIGEATPLRPQASIVVTEDSAAICEIACRLIVEASQAAIAARGRFSLSLSGGTTPRVVYERLATEPYRSALDWAHIHLFWGDERNVPLNHPDSNQGMTKAALIDHVPIPPENIHWIAAGDDPAKVAADQAADLRSYFAADRRPAGELPHFDLILLGMGEDGHTASLFPHTDALTAQDGDLFIANVVPQLNTTRLTLTAGVINAAWQVVFLVAGVKKADILHEVLRGPHLPDDHPSQRIQPIDGQLTFLLDRAAAAKL